MEQQYPTLSVVMAVHDEAEALEHNLPQFLAVAAEANAEVVVVDDMSADGTPDVLKRLRAEHANLYATFLPQSVVVNPSRLRLALSVGAKAAKAPRIVLADIHRPPLSAAWLTGLDDGEAALVYTTRRGDDMTHVVATDLDDLRATILKAERRSGRGHRGRWLKLRRGLYDAVSVGRERVFDAIRLFDMPATGSCLWSLRLRVWLSFH